MINDEIREIIDNAVSEYADNHWHRDDFEDEYERRKYLEEISEGTGWNDDAEDDVADMVAGEKWEDENGVEHEIDINDEDVREYIADAIVTEADWYLT